MDGWMGNWHGIEKLDGTGKEKGRKMSSLAQVDNKGKKRGRQWPRGTQLQQGDVPLPLG
jgi:hypothetical protein